MNDLLFVMQDANGDFAAMELSDLSDKEAQQVGPIAGDLLQVLEPDDIEAAQKILMRAMFMLAQSKSCLLCVIHTYK